MYEMIKVYNRKTKNNVLFQIVASAFAVRRTFLSIAFILKMLENAELKVPRVLLFDVFRSRRGFIE